jgi:hypothetical protein
MTDNERPYLDTPEKLEFPNETWAVQDLRKSNVLLYSLEYAGPPFRQDLFEKATFYKNQSINGVDKFPTKNLTRPIVLLLQNGLIYGYFQVNLFKWLHMDLPKSNEPRKLKRLTASLAAMGNIFRFSPQHEIEYLKWRLPSLK